MSIEQPIDPYTPRVENEDNARMENIGKRDDGKLNKTGETTNKGETSGKQR